MRTRITVALIAVAALCSAQAIATALQGDAKNKPPGGVQLLPGYTHKTLQGFDSRPGEIAKKNGLRITYDIGAIPKPGAPRFGGGYTDWTKQVQEKDRRWYREQTINNQPVHLVYSKAKRLIVSYPKGGINFSCETKTEADLVDALLITLSYAGTEPKPKK
ncbi:MAG: hypothetical protein H8E37_13445 [Planctomycetes bacterium]|nr:hypothetical protein [Planctomycetota bacterium]